MRFAIEAAAWSNPRGYGRFLRAVHRELVRRARHEWVLAMDESTAESAQLPPDVARIVISTGGSAAAGAAARARRGWLEMLRMRRGLSRGRWDAVLFPSPLTYVPVARTPEVLILHDVIFIHRPELVFESRGAARRWRWKTAVAVRRARRVVTVSESSRRGIAEAYGIDPRAIAVAPEAPDPIFFEPARPLRRDRPYALFVGGASPHKNLRVLMEALELVPEIDLVLAGPFETDRFHVEDAISGAPAGSLRGRVETISDAEDARLRDVYAGALALVLPSIEEGFGLPAVEAAAAGTPVILSRGVGAAELLESALLFDARDAEGLARHLRALLEDPSRRDELGRALRAEASSLSWEKTAEVVERAVVEAASG